MKEKGLFDATGIDLVNVHIDYEQILSDYLFAKENLQ